MASESEIRAQFGRLSRELRKRRLKALKLERYDGTRPNVPEVIRQAQITKAYGMLMPVAGAPWGRVVVRSVSDRLQVTGITDPESDAAASAVWDLWQSNQMDSEAKLGHTGALVTGRAFAVVWPGKSGMPTISLEPSDTMVVEFAYGSRRQRTGALRMWDEEGVGYAVLYRVDGLYKFRTTNDRRNDSFTLDTEGGDGRTWTRWDVDGEEWPLPNRFDEIPVVELGVNRELRTGRFPYAQGEFEHCLGLLDRIDLLTFLGLVVAFWMGFPLRGILGAKILEGDDGKPLPPFTVGADQVFQLEDPNAKIAEFSAADRGNLSIVQELAQLAYLTSTPAHYFPMANGLSNISADAIRALEGGLHAKVSDHKAYLGEGWEEVMRLTGLMRPDGPVILSPRATLIWNQSESRSLAEAADAAVKLKDVMPWQAIAQRYLDATQDDIALWETMRASDALNAVLNAAAPVPPAPVETPPPGA